jgi:hypothetical protein
MSAIMRISAGAVSPARRTPALAMSICPPNNLALASSYFIKPSMGHSGKGEWSIQAFETGKAAPEGSVRCRPER